MDVDEGTERGFGSLAEWDSPEGVGIGVLDSTLWSFIGFDFCHCQQSAIE